MKKIATLIIPALLCAAPGFSQERTPHTNYVLRCAGCHGMSGSGAPAAGIFDFNGMVGAFAGIDEGRTYLMHVPGVAGSGLSDSEIAAVMNYVMETWAGDSLPEPYEPFTAAEVTERRAIAIPDIVENRRQVAALLQTMGIETADYPWP
ncbi:MAG: cytochrome C [Rhizobiales bacterium]|nr:cytochrome C [Hyphomicrobiales bacterium]